MENMNLAADSDQGKSKPRAIMNMRGYVWLACVAGSGCATAEGWIPLTQTHNNSWEVRSGSAEFATTEGTNEPVVAFVTRVRRTDASVDFEKVYVRLSDCQMGFGKVVTTDLEGRPKFQNEFIFRGGNAASAIAEALCVLAVSAMDAPKRMDEPKINTHRIQY